MGAEKPTVSAVYMTAVEGKQGELKERLLEMVGSAVAAPGNRGFAVHQSTADAAELLIIEHWEGGAGGGLSFTVQALAGEPALVASGSSSGCWDRII